METLDVFKWFSFCSITSAASLLFQIDCQTSLHPSFSCSSLSLPLPLRSASKASETCGSVHPDPSASASNQSDLHHPHAHTDPATAARRTPAAGSTPTASAAARSAPTASAARCTPTAIDAAALESPPPQPASGAPQTGAGDRRGRTPWVSAQGDR